MKKMQKGFTLIELMIVVAIIAILAAIAIPAYQDYVIRSQVSEGSVLSDGAKTAISEFYNNKGAFPKSNASAGLATDTSISGKYVASVDASNGLIVAKFGNEVNKKVSGDVLVFSAITSAGSISWNCKPSAGGSTKTNVDPKYLPTACRG
ncbi:MAG: prepilin-type cleavage/methylation domain-containing protein [Lysobacterales bacterium 14-68-21]|jgi:type IV pilus assembly protein PilA|nr:MAG: prepilin-type cleavage/methylation domain-containing protein [Xanthomonadales bacterium 15-68-25]OZB67998.1 MAG: prepilin-type cleavage/methylation domain-containing protein [Xanthomonadales bacterium 14-68-21]